MIEQVGLVIILLTIMGSYLYATHRIAKLQKNYHNDERWQLLKLRAGNVTKIYYESLIIIIAMLTVILLWFPTPIMMPLDRMLAIGMVIIMGGQVVECFVIARLDKKM